MINECSDIKTENIMKAFEDAILRMGSRYKNFVVLNTDSSQILGLTEFIKFFGNRFFNMGLGYRNMAGCAAGFSIRNKIPFITGFSSFITGKAWEQIRDGICYPNLNIKIIGTHSGLLSGQEGVGFQSLEDIALMRVLPNMKVFSPADYYETMSVLESVVLDYGPTYIRLYDGELPIIYDQNYKFESGKSSALKQGNDVCIFATGVMVSNSLHAAEMLEKQGINATVVNISSIKPLDKKCVLECAEKTKFCVTAEDHSIIGGLGSAISELLEDKREMSLKRIGMKDRFGETGRTKDLYRKYMLDSVGIFEQVRSFVEKN